MARAGDACRFVLFNAVHRTEQANNLLLLCCVEWSRDMVSSAVRKESLVLLQPVTPSCERERRKCDPRGSLFGFFGRVGITNKCIIRLGFYARGFPRVPVLAGRCELINELGPENSPKMRLFLQKMCRKCAFFSRNSTSKFSPRFFHKNSAQFFFPDTKVQPQYFRRCFTNQTTSFAA